jgi:hypothetical protein
MHIAKKTKKREEKRPCQSEQCTSIGNNLAAKEQQERTPLATTWRQKSFSTNDAFKNEQCTNIVVTQ